MEDNNKTICVGKSVTILESRYNELKEDSDFLNCLQAAGVDNWEGYSDAQEMMGEGD